MAPFFPRNPTPWTDIVGSGLVMFYASMYILSGILDRFAPKTMSWVRREVDRRREAS